MCVDMIQSEALTPNDEVSDGGGRRAFWHVADGVESCMWALYIADRVGNWICDVPFRHRVRERRVFAQHEKRRGDKLK